MKQFLFIILILSFTSAKDVPFKAGESLKYSAEFNLIPVGQAELYVSGIEEIHGKDAYHISFSAQTKGLANQLFKIRDQIDIWMDSEKFFTHRLKKNIHEGSYKKSVDITFDYDQGIARTKTKEVEIDFKARDPFSMFYYLRTIPLKEKEIMSFTSFEGRKIVHYNLQMTGKEIINSPVGTFLCKVIRPFREGKNLFKNQGDMQIWISDDAKRLPVKIQIKMKFGSMTLLLKNIS
ncbi:MAG: DUF3108 domain-containing protein [Candidatus Marinimicrobia bacterium]|nr:DUF3108 domain-containing protein [Candidatus Neomarinimicrobiota bacterium]MBL7010275.1 DUF3108 domain-containing protein [Candidatus Neomarinimicrobiota bacterium]MBL7030203.1 DUF3108 domain-containing protein [Candidatus Neomarinimicrobiota bacterium]